MNGSSPFFELFVERKSRLMRMQSELGKRDAGFGNGLERPTFRFASDAGSESPIFHRQRQSLVHNSAANKSDNRPQQRHLRVGQITGNASVKSSPIISQFLIHRRYQGE